MGFGNRPSQSPSLAPTGGLRYPQLDRSTIVDALTQNASHVRYWRAVTCPCHNGLSGQPAVNCQRCRGLGFFHPAEETEEKYHRALVHSRKSTKRNDRGGSHQEGGASMTFLPGVTPGDGDLIQVCKDREVVNNEYHVVGATLTDGSTDEVLRFRDIICVEFVMLYNPATKDVTPLTAADWRFDPASRRIEFLREVKRGTRYSLRYQAVPEYIVKGDSVCPALRVSHDDGLPDPLSTERDLVYPFQCSTVRLDRAILSRLRGAVDLNQASTFSPGDGNRGPFK